MSDWLVLLNANSGHVAGTVAEIRATGAGMTSKEAESFGIVRVVDSFIKDDLQYGAKWDPQPTFTVLLSDTVLDAFRIELSEDNANSVGLGEINPAKVERFIVDWGGVLVSNDVNSVVFDITILNALRSNRFWDVNQSNIIFTQLAYDEIKGSHTIQVDYSALGNDPTYIENFVSEKVFVVGHDGINKVITFEGNRAIVKAQFEADIKKSLPRVHKKRYYFGPGVVNQISAAPGKILDSTIAQVLTFVKDKKDD